MRQPPLVEYKIVEECCAEDAEKVVNQHLREGWILTGILQTPVVGEGFYFIQPLIRPIVSE